MSATDALWDHSPGQPTSQKLARYYISNWFYDSDSIYFFSSKIYVFFRANWNVWIWNQCIVYQFFFAFEAIHQMQSCFWHSIWGRTYLKEFLILYGSYFCNFTIFPLHCKFQFFKIVYLHITHNRQQVISCRSIVINAMVFVLSAYVDKVAKNMMKRNPVMRLEVISRLMNILTQIGLHFYKFCTSIVTTT